MSVRTLLEQGGPIMLILLGMSVLALAILLFKLLQFSRLGVWGKDVVGPVLKKLEAHDNEGALAALHAEHGPVARVMEVALQSGLDTRMDRANTDAEVGRVGSREVRDMESWLRGLSSIAHLSPLLGLLGTVLGMITAFMRMQEAGSRVDPAVLSGGIWEALLTTAFGMAVAIPTMGATFFLEGQVDRTKAIMKDAAVRALVHCRKSPWAADHRVTLAPPSETEARGGV